MSEVNSMSLGGKSLPLGIDMLEEKINYKFKDRSIITCALTHSSYTNEMKSKGIVCECNERLEFLGDSVLSLVTSEYLYKNLSLKEGDLSRIRAGAVCEKALSAFASEIGLGDFLYLGHGEELSRGRYRASTTADAFEALLAAMYLDGGFELVKGFVLPFIVGQINQMLESGRTEDFKTTLQQIVQQEHGEVLEYILIRETGPAHRKAFEIEARLNSNVIGRGRGTTKREAEQQAAKEALSLFGAL